MEKKACLEPRGVSHSVSECRGEVNIAGDISSAVFSPVTAVLSGLPRADWGKGSSAEGPKYQRVNVRYLTPLVVDRGWNKSTPTAEVH